MVSSSLRVKPFAVLFWALGTVLGHLLQLVTQPACLASLNYDTVTVLYGRPVRFNLIEDASAPFLFPSSCIINLCTGGLERLGVRKTSVISLPWCPPMKK